MITHQFKLTEYKKALGALYNRGSSGALKVVFKPS
jgi:threonine dehydrogenase-like Zn-dependent dehydrogenase